MKKTVLFLLLSVFWFGLVTFLLCLPGSKLPSVGFLNDIYFDKWVHIGLFTILVYLWGKYFTELKSYSNKLLSAVIITGILYGAAMEFVQLYFIANRSFDVLDIAADAMGCFAGGYIIYRGYIKK